MAFCKNCGAQVEESYNVCPKCGQPLHAQPAAQPVQPAAQPAQPVAVEPKGPWKIFAILGLIMGILGFVGGATSIIGLVFSILGMKSVSKHGMAVAGLVLSIISLVVGGGVFVACLACGSCATCGAAGCAGALEDLENIAVVLGL